MNWSELGNVGIAAILALIGGIQISSDAMGFEPQSISQNHPDDFKSYSYVSIPLDSKAQLQLHEMDVDPVRQRVFRATVLKAGTELRVNSYLLARAIYESRHGFRVGPGFPEPEEIQKVFNAKDTGKFLALVTRLSEERRPPNTADEVDQAQTFIKGGGAKAVRPNEVFFQSGFLEVSAEDNANSKSDIRYFVSMSDVLKGSLKLDLTQAKMQVLKGVTQYLFQGVDIFYQNIGDAFAGEHEAVRKQFEESLQPGCSRNCSLTAEAALGSFFEDGFRILEFQSEDFLDPSEENRLAYRRLLCLMKKYYEICQDFNALGQIQESMSKHEFSCQGF